MFQFHEIESCCIRGRYSALVGVYSEHAGSHCYERGREYRILQGARVDLSVPSMESIWKGAPCFVRNCSLSELHDPLHLHATKRLYADCGMQRTKPGQYVLQSVPEAPQDASVRPLSLPTQRTVIVRPRELRPRSTSADDLQGVTATTSFT
jgi:hypothetical protein